METFFNTFFDIALVALVAICLAFFAYNLLCDIFDI
jgi:hypothetical protein